GLRAPTMTPQNVWSADKSWLRRVQPTFPRSSSFTGRKTPDRFRFNGRSSAQSRHSQARVTRRVPASSTDESASAQTRRQLDRCVALIRPQLFIINSFTDEDRR